MFNKWQYKNKNGFNERQINRTLNRLPRARQPDSNKPESIAFLPYVGPTFNRINRVLARHSIKSVGLSQQKLSNLLRPVKDNLELRTPGVYRIPCECAKSTLGRLAAPSTPDWKNINATSVWNSGQVGRSSTQHPPRTPYSFQLHLHTLHKNKIHGPHY
jgi:hypothetical protein